MSSYTADFALVCEGVTDYAVLKSILLGFFKGQPREPRITQSQPDRDATGEAAWQQFGSWENVFRYLRERLYRDALEHNAYLLVQIDTDLSAHPRYGVAQEEGGKPLATEEIVIRVEAKLREIIGPEDCAFYGERLVFAICVRDIECWLLPLWESGGKAEKTTGCLQTLNAALAQKDAPTINPNAKKVPPYENASRLYRKLSVLEDAGPKNPSLAIFLAELKDREITLSE